jgi:hypothetical protein
LRTTVVFDYEIIGLSAESLPLNKPVLGKRNRAILLVEMGPDVVGSRDDTDDDNHDDEGDDQNKIPR